MRSNNVVKSATVARLQRGSKIPADTIEAAEWVYVNNVLKEQIFKVQAVNNASRHFNVRVNAEGTVCDCPDAKERGQGCKHSVAVMLKLWSDLGK